jgi:hypothetical protein
LEEEGLVDIPDALVVEKTARLPFSFVLRDFAD